MTLAELRDFAERHRLRLRRGPDGDFRFPGRTGEVYAFGDGRMAALVLEETVRRWRYRRREALGLGMEIIQDGDTEGTLLFDPHNNEQAAFALKMVGARQKRRMSESALERLREYGREHRFKRQTHAAGELAGGQLAANADSDTSSYVEGKEGAGEAPCRGTPLEGS